VSRGSASHVLDAEAAPAAAEKPAGEAEEVVAEPEVTTRTFVVASRPVGAHVSLNGELLGDSSPLTIEVRDDQRYTLRVEKDGYRPATWAFAVEDLSAAHLESGELFFPLQAIAAEEEQLAAPAGTRLAVLGTPDAAPATSAATGTDNNAVAGGPPPTPASIRRLRAPAEAPAPQKLRHVAPTLPDGTDVDGVVVLEIEVSARGNVVQARVLRGIDPVADQAALDAVVRWKYEPPQSSGTPVHVLMTVSLPMRRSS
jgi:TonB family protein